MYPEQPAPPNYDANYLDQIASEPEKKKLHPFALWGTIGGGLLIIGLFFVLLFSSAGPNNTQRLLTFQERIAGLKTVTEASKSQLDDSKLSAANTSLSAILTSIESETAAIVGKYEPDSEAAKASQVTSEFDALQTKLDDARLNAQYDRVYAREVTYQIAQLRIEIVPLYEKSSSPELQKLLESTDTDLKALSSDIGAFNS